MAGYQPPRQFYAGAQESVNTSAASAPSARFGDAAVGEADIATGDNQVHDPSLTPLSSLTALATTRLVNTNLTLNVPYLSLPADSNCSLCHSSSLLCSCLDRIKSTNKPSTGHPLLPSYASTVESSRSALLTPEDARDHRVWRAQTIQLRQQR